MAAAELPRPLLRYHGGKWRIAPWILGHFPPHRIYLEPYCGAASLLLRKPRAHSEIINDLSADVVGLFGVLRSPRAGELIDLLRLTPFSRAEFELSYEVAEDPVECARRLIVRSFFAFGSDGHNLRVQSGFRAKADRSHTTPAHDWCNYPDSLRAVIDRLRGVVVECRDAFEVLDKNDGPETLHYVDPPYVASTRSTKARKGGAAYHGYEHELTDDDHRALAAKLRSLRGMVVLSGYPTDLYDVELFWDWTRVEKRALADGARERTEVLWLNQRAWSALIHSGPLFESIRQ